LDAGSDDVPVGALVLWIDVLAVVCVLMVFRGGSLMPTTMASSDMVQGPLLALALWKIGWLFETRGEEAGELVPSANVTDFVEVSASETTPDGASSSSVEAAGVDSPSLSVETPASMDVSALCSSALTEPSSAEFGVSTPEDDSGVSTLWASLDVSSLLFCSIVIGSSLLPFSTLEALNDSQARASGEPSLVWVAMFIRCWLFSALMLASCFIFALRTMGSRPIIMFVAENR
jgi:hypothetical protein